MSRLTERLGRMERKLDAIIEKLGVEDKPVVHMLIGGRTLCRMPGIPSQWPAGHRWVNKNNRDDVTCEACVRAM